MPMKGGRPEHDEADEMNEILNETHLQRNQAHPFDWRPAIERLHAEAEAAQHAGKPDSFAEIEAQCWIDLIEAEIAAHKRLDQSQPEIAAALHELRHWRVELELILQQLTELEKPASSVASAAFPVTAGNFSRPS
jgi:hypothetical protein